MPFQPRLGAAVDDDSSDDEEDEIIAGKAEKFDITRQLPFFAPRPFDDNNASLAYVGKGGNPSTRPLTAPGGGRRPVVGAGGPGTRPGTSKPQVTNRNPQKSVGSENMTLDDFADALGGEDDLMKRAQAAQDAKGATHGNGGSGAVALGARSSNLKNFRLHREVKMDHASSKNMIPRTPNLYAGRMRY